MGNCKTVRFPMNDPGGAGAAGGVRVYLTVNHLLVQNPAPIRLIDAVLKYFHCLFLYGQYPAIGSSP